MINEIKEAVEKATPGPWTHSRWAYGYVVTDYPLHNTIASVVEYCEDGAIYKEFDNWEPNRHLIANTPTYIRYLLDELEKANTENERIQLVSNDWQDEYESVNRRLIELDRSSGETLDLLRKSSRTIITKDAEIFDLRTEHTAMKEALEWYADVSNHEGVISDHGMSAVDSDMGERARSTLELLDV